MPRFSRMLMFLTPCCLYGAGITTTGSVQCIERDQQSSFSGSSTTAAANVNNSCLVPDPITGPNDYASGLEKLTYQFGAAPVGFVPGLVLGGLLGPVAFSASAQASIVLDEALPINQNYASAQASLVADLMTGGAVRQGLIDLILLTCNNGGGSATSNVVMVGSYTRSPFGCGETQGLMPFTLGTPFMVTLKVSESLVGFGSRDQWAAIEFALYEMNSDGTRGALVTPSLVGAPEPATWLLCFPLIAGLMIGHKVVA